MMLMMAATRHVRQAYRHVHACRWQDQWRVETPTISGKRLGVLGLGTIGSKIAPRAARGFDLDHASSDSQGCVPEVPALKCLIHRFGRRGRRDVPEHCNKITEA